MRVGDYELGRKLGEGAFGATFVAKHVDSGKVVVVKRLGLKGLPDWKPFERFEREAKVLRSLQHPGVVPFVDSFAGDDDYFIVSELVEGETLGQKIERGDRWSESSATELLAHLLETLAYLHELSPRVVHRDIKPGNVLIRPDGRPVLIDFGAALDLAARRSDGGLTVAGTAGYMPPEQAMGAAEPRSDLFGLGATVLHALSHTHPSELLDGLRLRIPNDVAVSPKLRRVLERLIEPNPSDRFPDAQAALQALRAEDDPAGEAAIAPRKQAAVAVTANDFVELAPKHRRLTDNIRELLHARAIPTGSASLAAQFAVLPVVGVLLAFGLIRLGGALFGVLFAIGGIVGPLAFLFRRRAKAIACYEYGAAAVGHILEAEQQDGGTLVTYRFRHEGTPYDGRVRLPPGEHRPEEGDAVAAFFDPAHPKDHVALLEAELP